MLTIVLLVALVAFVFIALLWKKRSRRDLVITIPGPRPSHATEGNNPDIKKAGNLSKYLEELHGKYGPIVAFREGKKTSVSIASPELFKETKHLFDQPEGLNEVFRPISGDESIGFKNGEEAKHRRRLYDQFFMMKACKTYYHIFTEIAREYVKTWKTQNENDHIPLMETLSTAAIKGILRTSFGNYFADEENVTKFNKHFLWVCENIEKKREAGSAEDELMDENVRVVQGIVRHVLEEKQKELGDPEEPVFADILLNESSITQSQRIADAITFLMAGTDTILTTLTWLVYQLTVQPDIQEKVYKELKEVLGDNSVTQETMGQLSYLRQVIDETLRYYNTMYTGRTAETDFTLGGHFIPKGTTIYQCLSLCAKNPELWANPDKFIPERFNPENSKNRHPFAFKPFGFAGKRQCPGWTFAYVQMSIYLSEWCKNFQFHQVPGQTISYMQGNKPDSEIWVTVTRRS